MNKTVTIGKCTVVCRNVPNNWTDDKVYHHVWRLIVNMNIKKAEQEILA